MYIHRGNVEKTLDNYSFWCTIHGAAKRYSLCAGQQGTNSPLQRQQGRAVFL